MAMDITGRKLFVKALLEEGVDIMYIQKILGHSSLKTTQIYLHIASNVQMEILKRLHPRNRMRILTAA